jgi:hypothetical protein
MKMHSPIHYNTNMSNQRKDTSLLLGVIPSNLCKPEQVARWCGGGVTPTYRLQRKPSDLSEFNHYNCRMAIWRNNGTSAYMTPRERNDRPNHELYLSMRFFCEGYVLHFTGSTDKAIAKRRHFFMTLERTAEEKPFIFMESYCLFYQLHAAGSRCLANIFKTAPSRLVEFEHINLSVKQTITLATRSHPINLGFWECEFEDDGTAFVEALERRESAFGSVRFTNQGFSVDNLKRVLQLDVIDYLEYKTDNHFVATALAKTASSNFQRTALLLADHTDMLHDLLQCARRNGDERVPQPRP